MKSFIDTGRKYEKSPSDRWWNLHYSGQPQLVLSAWKSSSGGWVVNAQPTSGGSYAGGGRTGNLALDIQDALKYLIEHGESKALIVSSIFQEEAAALADALFGWL